MHHLFLVILCFSTSAFASSLFKPKKIVLSIGISKFSDPDISNLLYPSSDAKKFFQVVTNNDDEFKGFLLTSENSKVTKNTFESYIENVSRENKSEDDIVVIYISSHGTIDIIDNKPRKFIVTEETAKENINTTSIDIEKLVEKFDQLRSKKKVLIFAFCNSGQTTGSILSDRMKRYLGNSKSALSHLNIFKASEGTLILSSSSSDQPAWESSEFESDIYTHFLIEAIKYNISEYGFASILESHIVSGQKTYAYTKAMKKNQKPSCNIQLDGADPIIIYNKKKSAQLSSSFKSKLATIFNSDYSNNYKIFLNSKEYPFQNGIVKVKEGRYNLEIIDQKTQRKIAKKFVDIKGGSEYTLSDYLVPTFANEFHFGFNVLSYSFNSKSSVFPGSILGITASYYHREFWRNFNFLVSGSFYRKQETVEVEGASFGQIRNVLALKSSFPTEFKISPLSKNDGSLKSDFFFGPGVNIQHIKLRRNHKAFDYSDVSGILSGPSLDFGVKVSTHHKVNFGLNSDISFLFTNMSSTKKSVFSYSFGIFAGVFW